jgi:hypothetical protein
MWVLPWEHRGVGRSEGAPVNLDGLVGFIFARLDEDEKAAALFHELTCPALDLLVSYGRLSMWCPCPVPRQILDRVQAARDVVGTCERQLLSEDTGGPGPLMTATKIQLGAIALRYELHPHWQEHWRP